MNCEQSAYNNLTEEQLAFAREQRTEHFLTEHSGIDILRRTYRARTFGPTAPKTEESV